MRSLYLSMPESPYNSPDLDPPTRSRTFFSGISEVDSEVRAADYESAGNVRFDPAWRRVSTIPYRHFGDAPRVVVGQMPASSASARLATVRYTFLRPCPNPTTTGARPAHKCCWLWCFVSAQRGCCSLFECGKAVLVGRVACVR